ncbi:MAG: hypothetical protein HY303_04975 [Candidatus Wallbacteria bacterium]|nr:hypothetical protein [Candidatus Wallbacteria bacterium]
MPETNEDDNIAKSVGTMSIGTDQAPVVDLVAVGVTGPTSAELGAPIALAGRVANYSDNSAPGFGVTFVLSSQSAVEFGNLAIGTQFVPSLAPHDSKDVTGTFPLPPFFRPGPYFLGMIVDSGNLVSESNERNNTTRSASPILVTTPSQGGRLVDLAALAVGARPAGVLNNDDSATPVVGENFGLGRIVVPGIGANETRDVRTETFVPPFVRPGSYFIAMIVDPDGRLPEQPETRANNKVLSANPFEVTTPDFLKNIPDLVATSVYGQTQSTAGQDFHIKWSMRGENIRHRTEFNVLFLLQPERRIELDAGRGVNVASDGEVKRYLPIGRTRVAIDGVKGSIVTTGQDTVLKLPSELQDGIYDLAIALDPDNEVPEFDKNNNFLEGSVPVQISARVGADTDDHADTIAEVQNGRDDLGVPGDARAALQSKKGGDRDVFRFQATTGAFYEVKVETESLADAILEIRDRDDRPVRRDMGEGRASRAGFTATYSGPYYAVVLAPFPFQTGSYRIGVRSFQLQTDLPDLVPGPVSIQPEAATSSTALTAFFSIGNGGGAAARKFSWELRLEQHVENEGLLFRPTAQATIVATGELPGLPALTGQRMPPVKFGPLPEGRYDVVLSVDTKGEVDERDEGNNSRPTPFAVGRGSGGGFGRVDLVPANMQIEPFRPGTSDPIQVHAAVANRGGSPATTFTVSLYLDRTEASAGTLLTTLTVDQLGPDSVFPMRPVTFGPLQEGVHNVALFVDDGDHVAESNEDNNVRVQEFFVHGSASTGYDLALEHVAVLPANPEQGQPIALGALVTNRGGQNSPPAVLRVWIDPEIADNGTPLGAPVASKTFDGVGSGEGNNVRKIDPLPLPPFDQSGRHKVVVKLEATEAGEQNTGNNQLTVEISVGEHRIGANQFVVRGRVLDPAGNPVGAGFRVRAYNRARRSVSSPSITPSSASQDGSYATTFGGAGATGFVVVDGDALAFEVLSDKDGRIERLQVSDPATRVVTAGEILAGGITQDLQTVPPPREEVTVEAVKPDDDTRVLPDDKIEFRGQATDEQGERLSGRRLVWSTGNPPRIIGLGENFVLDAKLLRPGRNEIVLEAFGRARNNVTRRTVWLQNAIDSSSRLAIVGKIRSAPKGEIPTEPLTLVIRNVTRGLDATATIDTDTGRYSAEFTSAETSVVAAGDKFEARLSNANGTVPISPPVFHIGRRDVSTGQHERNFRAHFEPPVLVDLLPGVNLISVPLRPVTSGTTDYDCGSLSRDLHLNWLVRSETGPDGRQHFRVFLPDSGLTPGFTVNGNEGYICSRTNAFHGYPFRGVQWEDEQVDRQVGRGVNSIGYPRDVPDNHTARDLAEQIGSSLVVETEEGPDHHGRFRPFLPGSTTDAFGIHQGAGYLLGSQQDAPLTLEHSE